MTRVLAIATAFVVRENRSVFQSLSDDFGLDVTVISPDSWVQARYGTPQRFEVQPEESHRFRVVPLRFNAGRLERYYGLAAEIRKAQPTVAVCAQEYNAISTIHSLALCRILCRGAMTVSCSLQNMPYPLHRLHHRLQERVAFSTSDAVLASCRDAAELLKLRGYRGHVEVMYPLGAAAVHRPTAPEAGVAAKPFTIGFVGRIAAEKGVFDLVRAVATLDDSSQLIFVGDGPDRVKLETLLAELGVSDRATFVGLVQRSDLGGPYGHMDALVLPSRTTPKWKEQFGVVLAEAMTLGIPVVGSTSGAIPEVIGDAGLVFPEGDIESLCGCLRTLRDDTVKRKALAVGCAARGQALYTPRAIAARLLKVFEAKTAG